MMDKISPESHVSIRFVMRSHLPNGIVKERPPEELEFIFGIERQAPTLEKSLDGACLRDKFSVLIPAAEIYGVHDPELIREIPKKGLLKQRIRKGQRYRQMKMGSLVSFKVLEINPETVLVDFNKPMAGISVSMEVEVLAIRKAEKEEINTAIEVQMKKNIGCG